MSQAAEQLGPPIGAFGSLLVAALSVISAFAYSGSAGEPYSPLNHWVSELGETGVSQLAPLFNLGLVVGGSCYALFMVALAIVRRTGLAWLYAPIGVLAGIGGAFVGVFPINNRDLHGLAALAFFNLGWISVGLASLDFVRRRDARFPLLLGEEGLAAPETRPEVWIVPILEWAVVGGILTWTLATSVTWWRASHGAGS
jgi:hypothetical membrane protein